MSSSKTRITIIILTAALLLSGGFAIHYAGQVSDLKKELSEIENNKIEQRLEPDPVIKDLKMVDSLILSQQYDKAAELSRELRTKSSNSSLKPLELRYQLVNALVEKENKIQEIQQSQSQDSIRVDESDEGKDSTSVALREARKNIKQLQSKLEAKPTTEYLDFKTTRGTELHYVGAVKDGKANGYGIAILDSGSRYEGFWKDNMRHGMGEFLWDDGERYVGEYLNDMRHGTGTYYWGNGSKYVGEWKNDGRNGKGKFYNRRGKLKDSGVWKNDELVEKD